MRRIWLLAALTLCMSFWAPTDAAGQEMESSSVSVMEMRAIGFTHKLKAEFQDCTVQEAFALVEKALEGKVNIIVHPSAKDVQIPAFTARYVNALMLTNIICNLVMDLDATISVGGSFDRLHNIISDYPTDDDLVMNYLDDQDPKQVPVILINLVDSEEMPVERAFRVYGVSKMLHSNEFTIHDIATAVETAWQMYPSNYSASLKYHEETGLLICSGTDEHLDILDELIIEIQNDDRLDTLKKHSKQLEERNHKLEVKCKALEDENAKLHAQVKDLTDQLNKVRTELLQESSKRK